MAYFITPLPKIFKLDELANKPWRGTSYARVTTIDGETLDVYRARGIELSPDEEDGPDADTYGISVEHKPIKDWGGLILTEKEIVEVIPLEP